MTETLERLQQIQNGKHGTSAPMSSFNDEPPQDGEKNPRIYDHLTDEVASETIRRVPDDLLEIATSLFSDQWIKLGLLDLDQSKANVNIERIEAEQRFRQVLEANANLREKYKAEGIMGILFEPSVIELLPWDVSAKKEMKESYQITSTKNVIYDE